MPPLHRPITRAFVRELLRKSLISDSDLDAFCLDHFPDVHGRFGSGMDRVTKINILLERKDPEEIFAKLTDAHPEPAPHAAGPHSSPMPAPAPTLASSGPVSTPPAPKEPKAAAGPPPLSAGAYAALGLLLLLVVVGLLYGFVAHVPGIREHGRSLPDAKLTIADLAPIQLERVPSSPPLALAQTKPRANKAPGKNKKQPGPPEHLAVPPPAPVLSGEATCEGTTCTLHGTVGLTAPRVCLEAPASATELRGIQPICTLSAAPGDPSFCNRSDKAFKVAPKPPIHWRTPCDP
jgi:hypothetical protein